MKIETGEIYQQGYEGFVEGLRLKDNPYIDTDNENYWRFGWEMAKDDRSEYLDSISPFGSDF
jgi:ribosome modulation factor